MDRRPVGGDGHVVSVTGAAQGTEALGRDSIEIWGVGEIPSGTATTADALSQDPISASTTCGYFGAGLQFDLDGPAVAASAPRGRFRDRGDLSTNGRPAASTDRLRHDGVCIEASGCDRAAGKNVDVATRANTAVLTAEVQRKSVNV